MSDLGPPDAASSAPGPSPAAADFVVEYDRQRVRAVNDRAARVLLVSASITTGVALLVVVLSVLILTSRAGPITGVIVVALAAVAVWLAVRAWRAVRAFGHTARRMHNQQVALRVTDEGVQIPDPERGGTVVLPWHAIGEARIVLQRGEQVLLFELARDFRPHDPAARGLDDPDVWKRLLHGTLGMPGPRFGMRLLRQSSHDIDVALREHSAGRVSLS